MIMKKLPYIPKTILLTGLTPIKSKTQKIRDEDKTAKWRIVGFDTESYVSKWKRHELLSSQICYQKNNTIHCDVSFNPTRDINRLLDFPNKSFIFAHNLEFDLLNLIGMDLYQFLKRKSFDGWRGFFIFGASGLARFSNKKLGISLKFIDTMNFFKGSLKYVAKSQLPNQYHKITPPYYLGKRKPDKNEIDDFIRYAVRDAEICYLLGLKIFNLHKKSNIRMSYTPASMAVKVYRKNFLTNRWLLPQKQYINFIWNTYAGARFESYGRGKFGTSNNPIKIYDINSLYPYACIQPLPFESAKNLQSFTLEEWEKDQDKIIGWVRIAGRYSKNELYPQMPNRTKKLYYPLNFYSWATTHELKNCIKDINIFNSSIVGFYPTKKDINHPIKDYVDYFYKKKSDLDLIKELRRLTTKEKEERQFYKLLLNSLYGKTAERNKNFKTNLEKAGVMFNPSIASLITGFARSKISRDIKKYEALYADTDSIFTHKKIKTNSRLGEYKLEAKGIVVLIRPKLYFVFENEDGLLFWGIGRTFTVAGLLLILYLFVVPKSKKLCD